MEKEERKKYKDKIELHRKLGAEKFQKVVFKFEELKYKLLKKVCPNFITYYDKFWDFKGKLAIRRAKTDTEKQNIISGIKMGKLLTRKQFNSEKNINYHMRNSRRTEICKYLEWNKEVHKQGLIKNLIVTPILVGVQIAGFPVLPLIILEIISMGINFECINLQDYNLCRYKLLEDKLKKREEKRIESNITNYGEAAKVIHKSIEENEKIPTIEEIIDNVENKEQLEQLRALLIREQQERKNQAIGGKKKMTKELLTTIMGAAMAGGTTAVGTVCTTLNDDGTVNEKKLKTAIGTAIATGATTLTGNMIQNHDIKKMEEKYATSYVESMTDKELEAALIKMDLLEEEVDTQVKTL